ncbi:type II toxin-antitoxin system HigB family toxin [Geofilum rhodophaeum]|uniref:type II toxin-antitoxin system HigB family toxin n=1 Tax=Geofilum rhodophaeum TaxID=1965019 RepID=UPI000B522490|nr:type II toxin-antitoxin system HigB family toxin [Geofilum rhodophaeum]
MHIFSRTTLLRFSEQHSDLSGQFIAWYKQIEKTQWKTLNEIKEKFPRSSILKNSRMVFRIKSYRLVVEFMFEAQRGFIKWIGTHDEYDKIDANTIDRSKP